MEARLQALTQRHVILAKDIGDLQKALCQLQQSFTAEQGVVARHCAMRDLKELQPCSRDTPEVAALRCWCFTNSLHSAVFRWVPTDYYQHTLQWRRDILGAPSIHHICKSIFMENTHCVHQDCAHRENSRYYLIVYPYTERFDGELVTRHVKELNQGLGKKKFNFRIAQPDVALRLTGFCHGAVAPFGTATDIPVILSDRVVQLTPAMFWMGGGHVDCKVRVDVAEFMEVVKPIVASFTTPLSAEELEQMLD